MVYVYVPSSVNVIFPKLTLYPVLFLVIVIVVSSGNGVPSSAVIVNSNESPSFQLRPSNSFNTNISISPLNSFPKLRIVYVFVLPSFGVITNASSLIGSPLTCVSIILYVTFTSSPSSFVITKGNPLKLPFQLLASDSVSELTLEYCHWPSSPIFSCNLTVTSSEL